MTSFFSNDEYENIPLVGESQLSSSGTRHSSRAPVTESHTFQFIHTHKKILFGVLLFIALMAIVSFASSSGPTPTTINPEAARDVLFAEGASEQHATNQTYLQDDSSEQQHETDQTDLAEDDTEYPRDPVPDVMETSPTHIGNDTKHSIVSDVAMETSDQTLPQNDTSIVSDVAMETSDQARPQNDTLVVQGGSFVATSKKSEKSKGGKGKGKGKNGNKQRKAANEFDLSSIHDAMKSSSDNLFNVDYSTIIRQLSEKYPKISGDLEFSSADYHLRRFPGHRGHDDEVDVELFHSLRFFHFSDTHIDPFFNPFQTSQPGVCASCHFNDKVYGESASCPIHTPFVPDILDVKAGYSFGRLKCNPPPALLTSLLASIRHHQREPSFLLISGDVGAHGRKDDAYHLEPTTTLNQLCSTKFDGMRETFKMIREVFPNTPVLFTPGNNDHLPKNKVWSPYFEALASLLVEMKMLHPSQASLFSRIGSHFVDLEVDNQQYVKFISEQAKNNTNVDISKKMLSGLDEIPDLTKIRIVLPNMTLLAPGGEVSFVDPSKYEHLEGLAREDAEFPKRAELISFLNQTLFDAQKDNRHVLIAGHQPLSTKKGSNELLLTSTTHGLLFKALIAQYASIIKGAFFGHRNLASIQNILSPSNEMVVPSIVIPGVSPRGNNLPAFHEVMLSRSTGTILDFEQFVFDIIENNEKALILSSALKGLMTKEQLLSDADSGSQVVHSVIAARINDEYDPESFAEHERLEEATAVEKLQKEKAAFFKEKTEKQIEEYNALTAASDQRIMKHGFDCGDDVELCQFIEKYGYLGVWTRHPDGLKSWRQMSGFTTFTAQTVADMNSRVTTSGRLFTSLQVFKRAGFIGDETPENVLCKSLYDDEINMMTCLFPDQDPTPGCFNPSWIK